MESAIVGGEVFVQLVGPLQVLFNEEKGVGFSQHMFHLPTSGSQLVSHEILKGIIII
jgi:hypothetical protein